MFIELLDNLRCVEAHPQISLVTAITRREDRYVLEAVSGCPTCRREYPIVHGAAWFRPRPNSPSPRLGAGRRDPEGAVRIGALLGVSDGATVALVGDWAQYSLELAEMVDIRAFAVNPAEDLGESERVGVVYSDSRLPFADASMRGVAIGESGWSAHDLEVATRALSPGGRMVGPVSAEVPSSIEEITRDDRVWVGERRAPLVALHRR